MLKVLISLKIINLRLSFLTWLAERRYRKLQKDMEKRRLESWARCFKANGYWKDG